MSNTPEINEVIFTLVDNIIVVADRTGAVVRMNPTAERLTGYSLKEAMGVEFWKMFIPEDEREIAKERFAKLLTGDWPPRYEREWISRDGKRHQISWLVGVPREPDGTVRYVVGTGTDVTESRRAETALRDQTRLLRSVLESVGDGVAVADETGAIIIYTPEMERIVGRPRPSGPPEQWGDYFHFYLPDGVTHSRRRICRCTAP